MTNHVFTAAMKAKEYYPSYSAARSSRERLAAVERGLGARVGRGLTPQDAVDLVSGGPVALLNNVQSVVMAPARGSAYVAVADIEGGKPMDGRYVEVPLDPTRVADEVSARERAGLQTGAPPPASAPEAAVAQAHAWYREGARLGSVELLDRADDWLVAGLTCLKIGRISDGEKRLLRAAVVEADPYHQSLAHLFLGRVYLSQGAGGARLGAVSAAGRAAR